MASVNKWIGIGRLGRDPETRHLPSGDSVCNISIACSDSFKDKQTGEKKEITEWVQVAFFGRLAEIAGLYLRKGSQVYVEGSLRTRKWQDKDGNERYTTEIRADRMQMLGDKQEGTTARASSGNPASGGGAAGPGGIEGMDDDIPFIFNANTVRDTMGVPKSLWRARYGKGLSLMWANKADF